MWMYWQRVLQSNEGLFVTIKRMIFQEDLTTLDMDAPHVMKLIKVKLKEEIDKSIITFVKDFNTLLPVTNRVSGEKIRLYKI